MIGLFGSGGTPGDVTNNFYGISQYSSIAALKGASLPADGTKVVVGGHTANGDGGGGVFYFDEASSATDDGGIVIAPTEGSGRWRRVYSGAVNVRWFGAKGDGETDDLLALRAAADANVCVYIPPGTYSRSDTITFNHGVFGERGASVLLASNPLKSAIILNGDGAFARDFTINSPNSTVSSTSIDACGISVRKISDFVVENITVDSTANAAIHLMSGCNNGAVRNNRVKDCLVNSIMLNSTDDITHDVVVSGNVVYGGTDDLIALISWDSASPPSPMYNISVIDNILYDQVTQGRGIAVAGGRDIIVSRNQIRNTYGAGVVVMSEVSFDIGPASYVKISENIITDCPSNNTNYGAIHVAGDNHATSKVDVTNNVIRNAVLDGIVVTGTASNNTTDVRVSGNSITDSAVGVKVYYTKNIIIDNNNIYDATSYGIFVDVSCSGRVRIQGNNGHNVNTSEGAAIDFIQMTAPTRYAVISDNYVNSTHTIDTVVEANNAYNAVIQNNFSAGAVTRPANANGPNTSSSIRVKTSTGTAAPTEGEFSRGDIRFNSDVTAGGTLMWACTTAGALGADWAHTTAYKYGNIRKNDTNKYYRCVVGGTSAGSGGPTGTGSGITDGTATWDYVSGTTAVFTTVTAS